VVISIFFYLQGNLQAKFPAPENKNSLPGNGLPGIVRKVYATSICDRIVFIISNKPKERIVL
jgi:hypothetical protein